MDQGFSCVRIAPAPSYIAIVINQLGDRVYIAHANLGRNGRFGTTRNRDRAAHFRTEEGARRACRRVFRNGEHIETEIS